MSLPVRCANITLPSPHICAGMAAHATSHPDTLVAVIVANEPSCVHAQLSLPMRNTS